MESVGSETAASSSPHLPIASVRECSFLSEPEPFELSTTVDPSYIIHLIRQLLPSLTGKDVDRSFPIAKVADNDAKNNRPDDLQGQEVWGKDLNETRNAKEVSCDSSNVKICDLSGSCVKSEEPSGNNLNESIAVLKEISPVDLPSGEEKNIDGMAVADSHLLMGRDIADSLHHQILSKGDILLQKGDSHQKVVEQAGAEHIGDSVISEDQREEAGCVLWDLAASQSHAEFMVENHLLEVLLAILSVSHSDRMREICLGIMGNLACHAGPEKAMVEMKGLVEKVAQSLFVNDSPSLSEACRLLSAGLHSEDAHGWVKAIESEQVLERIIWIAANTMNSQLLEKSTELLLAMVDCQRDAASVLLSPLVHSGLPELLTDLLTCELTAIVEGTSPRGDVVLDTLLQIAEALSLTDEYAAQLAANKKLFNLACRVIQLSGKDEVGPAGITATVLIANLLAEEEERIQEILPNLTFLKQLLGLLPSAGDDPGARNALWSILGRICINHLSKPPEEQHSKQEMLLVLADGCEILSEDLHEHRDDDLEDAADTLSTGHSGNESTGRGFKAKLLTIDNILRIMERWRVSHNQLEDSDLEQIIENACSLLRRNFKEEPYAGPECDLRLSHKNGFSIHDHD